MQPAHMLASLQIVAAPLLSLSLVLYADIAPPWMPFLGWTCKFIPPHICLKVWAVAQVEAGPVDPEQYENYRSLTDLREPYRCA